MKVPKPARILRKLRETRDTFTLVLDAQDLGNGFRFEPGQFNMLYMFGAGDVPISFSGDPGKSSIIEHTVREHGSVTRSMCRLKRGDFIGVSGPFGSAWPIMEAEGKNVIIMAGGIGLAPLRPLMLYLLSHRKQFDQVVLLYGARSPADLLYQKQLRRWRSRFDIEVEVTVDHAGADWRGNVGVITALRPTTVFDPANTIAMICGPEIMMRYSARLLREWGLPEDRIYITMERNMKCAVGHCGHCQFGPKFVCKDGPVFCFGDIAQLFETREI